MFALHEAQMEPREEKTQLCKMLSFMRFLKFSLAKVVVLWRWIFIEKNVSIILETFLKFGGGRKFVEIKTIGKYDFIVTLIYAVNKCLLGKYYSVQLPGCVALQRLINSLGML